MPAVEIERCPQCDVLLPCTGCLERHYRQHGDESTKAVIEAMDRFERERAEDLFRMIMTNLGIDEEE